MLRSLVHRLFKRPPTHHLAVDMEALLEANRLLEHGQFDQAEAQLLSHAAANNQSADHHFIYGKLHAACGRRELAISSFKQACTIRPELAAAHALLADNLIATGDMDAAIEEYRRTIELEPDSASWHNNFGHHLFICGQIDNALNSFQRAIELNPYFPEAHFNQAIAFLVKGDFRSGWLEYEWRPDNLVEMDASVTDTIPLWNGQAFPGKTLLVETEQGFGDTIFFARFLPILKSFEGEIWLKCGQPVLSRLLESNGVVTKVLPANNRTELSKADLRFPIASLPLQLGIDLKDLPGNFPYLAADPQLVQAWHARLAYSDRLKVGIVWAGNPLQRNDRFRSAKLSDLAPLAKIEGVEFYSLQKDAAGDVTQQYGWIDLTPELKDFADTAAFVQNLDLIISVDTSVAHLAGAMGKPVLLMGPKCPDWRWEINGQLSPWYPSVRVFRQKEFWNWSPVVSLIADELARLVANFKVHNHENQTQG